MAHPRNIVPSKDALRALRSLALSPHTALVGTVGSVCGLVAIHHHQRRKVRLAEQIIETKRTIQTLSGGRGNVQAIRMFEAAERGDDFTLHHGRPKKPRRSRRYSAAAMQEKLDDTAMDDLDSKSSRSSQKNDLHDYRPFSNTIDPPTGAFDKFAKPELLPSTDIKEFRPYTDALDLYAEISDKSMKLEPPQTGDISEPQLFNTAADLLLRASGKPEKLGHDNSVRVQFVVSEPSGNKLPLDESTGGLNQQSPRPVKTSWARLSPSQNSGNKWTERFAEAAQERLRKRWELSIATDDQSLQSSTKPSAEGLAEQVPTDLNPVPLKNRSLMSESVNELLPGLSAEESLFFNFVFGKPSPDSVFQSGFFQTLYQSDMETKTTDQVLSKDSDHAATQMSDSVLPEQSSDVEPLTAVPYITDGQEAPTTTLPSLQQSRSRHDVDEHGPGPIFNPAVNRSRYFYVYNTLVYCLEHEGRDSCLKLFEMTYEAYGSTGSTDDFELLNTLVFDISRHFQKQEFAQAIRRSVRQVLAKPNPNLLVIQSLYRAELHSYNEAPSRRYIQARTYLEEFGRSVRSHDSQVLELRKILDGTMQIGIPLDELLMAPVLRSLCGSGKVSQAQIVFDEITKIYNIETSFYLLSILMKGYAAVGMWPKVKAMMDDHHSKDLSWKKLYGFAAMFGGTISQYADNYTPERLYGFVLHAIKEYSLFPTSTISNRVICQCLRARRYDLVQKWINMVQTDFPMLDLGIGNQEFAVEIAEVWQNMEASCEDILYGCRALSTNAIRDPFSKVMRGMASEASLRDLSRRVKQLDAVGSHKLQLRRYIDGMHSLLHDVHQLISKTFTDGFTMRTRLMAQDLVQQTKAVVNLDLLFSGSHGVQTRGQPEDKHLQHHSELTQDQPRMPHGLRTTRLPTPDGIVSIMTKHYTHRVQKNQSIEHWTLKTLLERLIKVNRLSDAYNIIELVYESSWAGSVMSETFDIDLFITWLKVAKDLQSDTKLRAVLWAIADAGPKLRLNSEIILLARTAVPSVISSRFRQANNYIVLEMEYLRKRLKIRRALQGDIQLQFARWKSFGDYTGKRRRNHMEMMRSKFVRFDL